MKRHKLAGLLAGVFLLMVAGSASAFNARQPFDIVADSLEYQDEAQLIIAEGHVMIIQTSSTLTADYLRFDHLQNRIFAKGNVILREKDQVVAGDVMDYDLTLETGHLIGSKMFASPWKLQAESWERVRDFYIGREAAATSCDLIDPHYHIRSSRMHFVPNRGFWAWNNTFYVDQTGLFYSPFIYKSLEKRRVVFQAQPGHDTVNGAFAKTQTTVRFTDTVYDKILWDHYTVAGNGFGNEFDYNPNSSLKGSLFGYYINPNGTPELVGAPKTPQYNIRSYHYEKLPHSLTLQSNVNIRENVSFNNQFFQQDFNQAVSDVQSSIALTQQTKKFNQRLVVERFDSPDVNDTSLFARVHTQTASYPRYEFTMYQTPLWSPTVSTTTFKQHVGALQLSASASLDDRYERADDQTRLIGSGQFTLSQTIPMGRFWTFTPTITPSLRWQQKEDPGSATAVSIAGSTGTAVSSQTVIPVNLFRGSQGRFSNADTLRFRPFSSITLDNTYTLTERMAPDGLGLDRAVSDGGIETNHVNWLLFWRPSRSILLRSYSGYDLRTIADEDPNAYRQRRVDPWTSELTFDPPRASYSYFVRYQLSYYPFRDSLSEASVAYLGLHRTRLETGILYNQGQSGVLTSNNRVGYYFSPGWRVDSVVHAFIPTSQNTVASIIDSEVILVRDMHCWEAQFVYRYRPPFIQEYSMLFNLKLGAAAAKEITNEELETQFYPWRANAYSR